LAGHLLSGDLLDDALHVGGLQAIGDLRRHIGLVVLGEHLFGVEDPVGAELALGDDPLALAEQVGQDAGVADRTVSALSVTAKRTVSPSCCRAMLSATTSPPRRNTASAGASLASTWDGLKK
jgi:hypothetical protein